MKPVSRIATLIFIIFILSASAALADDRICVTRYVPDWFPTIQECIDASSDCDTCLVSPGVYVENIDFRGKAITVKGDYFEYRPTINGNQNGSVVTFANGEMEDSILEGFTIRNGSGHQAPSYTLGGGIYCHSSSPTIMDCTIMGSHADLGGGIYCLYSDPTITNCTITGNDSVYSSAGIECDRSSTTISNCIISGNNGSGIEYINPSSPLITSCTISGNSGSGIYCAGNVDLTITNCTITGNIHDYGGGLLCLEGPSLMVTNCTISENSADANGGGICLLDSTMTITNSIFWGNSSPEGPEISAMYSSTVTVSYSDVQGGEAAAYLDGGILDWGPGNIDANPSFVGGGDYHLSSWSPCIDTGTDAGVYDDIDGDVRPIGAGFDMGSDEAPEFQPIIFDLRAYYSAGMLSLDYTIGTPVSAMWANYLILTAPAVQVIPLWTISLPAISPPMEIPISIPFPVLGTIGIWTALFDEYGSQTMKLEWVDTGG